MVELKYILRNLINYFFGVLKNVFHFNNKRFNFSTKFSIIIPIYNSAKTIKYTLESIRKQNYKNLEVLCVDNGSTDKSCEIITNYMKIYKKVNLLFSSHGVSRARNEGILKSKGSYLIFLDSDDELLPNSIKNISYYLKTQPDILVCSGKKDFGSFSSKLRLKSSWSKKINNCKNLLFSRFYIRPHAANKVFSKKFIINNKIFFDTSLNIGEDQEFIFKSFTKAKIVISTNIKMYYYKHNVNSSMALSNNDYYKMTCQHYALISKVFNLYKKIDDNLIIWSTHLLYNHSFKFLDQSNKTLMSKKIFSLYDKYKVFNLNKLKMPITSFYYNKMIKCS